MLERTALKFYPIIQEVARRMTRHKETQPSEYGTASRTQRGEQKDRISITRDDDDLEEDERLNPYQSKWIMQK